MLLGWGKARMLPVRDAKVAAFEIRLSLINCGRSARESLLSIGSFTSYTRQEKTQLVPPMSSYPVPPWWSIRWRPLNFEAGHVEVTKARAADSHPVMLLDKRRGSTSFARSPRPPLLDPRLLRRCSHHLHVFLQDPDVAQKHDHVLQMHQRLPIPRCCSCLHSELEPCRGV